MVYLPTFTTKNQPNVGKYLGKYRYINIPYVDGMGNLES